MRKLMIGCAIGVMVVSLAGCTGSGVSSEAEQELQGTADR